MSLPKTRRVLRSSEFRETYNRGARTTTRFFVAFLRRTKETSRLSQFGFTTPRALGKAVIRNRIKRRMREAVRHEVGDLAPGWIIILNPRRSVLDAGFEDLCLELRRLLTKCKRYS